MKFLLTLFLTIFIVQAVTSINISEEKVTIEELQARVTKFNNFYHNLNPDSKNVEIRVDDNGKLSLYSLTDLAEGDTYFKANLQQVIWYNYIYTTKYSEALQEVEASYGFDDIVNLVIILIAEKHDENGKWKPFVDILPAKPNTLTTDFWTRKTWAEPIAHGTGLISKYFITKRKGT